MPESSPWDDIAVPGADFNVRRVAVGTAVPCFWGRDVGGACLFIVELQGDHAAQYRKNAVTVNGIDVDLRTGDQGRQHLVLALERQVDRDLFEGLCRTLASSLEHATDSTSSLAGLSGTHPPLEDLPVRPKSAPVHRGSARSLRRNCLPDGTDRSADV